MLLDMKEIKEKERKEEKIWSTPTYDRKLTELRTLGGIGRVLARKASGQTISELASQLNVNPRVLYKIVKGELMLTRSVIDELTKFVGMTKDILQIIDQKDHEDYWVERKYIKKSE